VVDNIKVKPATERTAVSVATDEISSEHHPLYKIEFGEDGVATLVSENNPLPTANTARQKHNFARQEELLTSILLELKILNKYMSFGQDVELTDNDIEE